MTRFPACPGWLPQDGPRKVAALLRVDGPLYTELARDLPADAFAQLKPGTSWLLRSLNESIREIRLLDDIRRTVEGSESARRCRRLIVSASPPPPPASALRKRFHLDEKDHAMREAAHELHRRQASLNADSEWLALLPRHRARTSARSRMSRAACTSRPVPSRMHGAPEDRALSPNAPARSRGPALRVLRTADRSRSTRQRRDAHPERPRAPRVDIGPAAHDQVGPPISKVDITVGVPEPEITQRVVPL